jgi:hypothetical protein
MNIMSTQVCVSGDFYGPADGRVRIFRGEECRGGVRILNAMINYIGHADIILKNLNISIQFILFEYVLYSQTLN